MRECIKILKAFLDDSEFLEKKYDIFLIRQLTNLDPFFPIKCVACIEGYFRLVYANLIDFGDPYRNNAKQFSDIKFSTEIVLSLDGGNVSVGDFISHLLPINNFENLNSIMSTLIGEDFKCKIKEIFLAQPQMKPLFGTTEDIFENIVKRISEMFKLRHIYCHELGVPEKVIATPVGFVEATGKFIHLSELLVEKLLNVKT